MTRITLGILDKATGQLLLDSEVRLSDGRRFADVASQRVAQVLGEGQTMGCANPNEPQQFPVDPDPTEQTISVRDYWHDSFIEGPGRRSVVRMQGCPIRCAGCWVPETHDFDGGEVVGVDRVAHTLLDSAYSRDGVTILGGEPFAQPDALLALCEALREDEPELHLTVYSGFTLARLQAMAHPAIDRVLSLVNLLIDGPLVIAMRHGDCACSEQVRQWTGSCNQKVRVLR